MSFPLIVKSKLFWSYNGRLDACWGLGMKDGTSIAMQDAYIHDMDRFGADTITLNICNERLSSPFSGEFMNSSWHEGKIDVFFNFCRRLKNSGKNVVAVYFDFPGSNNGKDGNGKPLKYPFWMYKDRIPAFLEIGTKALSPIVDGFIFGIESSRQPCPSLPELDYAVGHIRKFAKRMVGDKEVQLPVGTHEQTYRIASNADFIGYETSNHPVTQGDSTSVAQMVSEVNHLVSVAGGRPVWVIESNSSEGAKAREQNRAMAALPGVAGIGGPM